MKIQLKKLEGVKRELNVELSGEIVINKSNEVIEKFAKEAKVAGFRPGNVPRDILMKRFSSDINKRVIEELIPSAYSKALEKEGIEAVELPEISDVKLDGDKISFKANFEAMPEIKLPDYKGIKIDYKAVSVSDDDLKRSLDSLKEARKADSLDDTFARCLGYPDLEELKAAIKRQILVQRENMQRQAIEQQAINSVTKDVSFSIPAPLIKRQFDELVRQAKVDLAMRGMQREEIDKQEESLSKELADEARKQVKVYLSLSEIAKKEKIPADEAMPRKVIELLLREAEWKIEK